MSVKFLENIISVDEVKKTLPINTDIINSKKLFDLELKNIFLNKSKKFLLIIGPCSADNENAVLEYCHKLKEVSELVKDKIFIIPRVYTTKPRTNTSDYKGLLHQITPGVENSINKGILASRSLHLKIIKETGFFTADELLYLYNLEYLDDLLSYIAIGARSIENQEHRLYASAFDIPVGMKNPTNGNLNVLLNALASARNPHKFKFFSKEVLSSGNELAHAILRGYVDKNSNVVANYHYEDILEFSNLIKENNLKEVPLIIDTNHANSNKNYKKQIEIAKNIIEIKNKDTELSKMIKGLMIESYLISGSAEYQKNIYGQSITDPCLDFDSSKNLILYLYENLRV